LEAGGAVFDETLEEAATEGVFVGQDLQGHELGESVESDLCEDGGDFAGERVGGGEDSLFRGFEVELVHRLNAKETSESVRISGGSDPHEELFAVVKQHDAVLSELVYRKGQLSGQYNAVSGGIYSTNTGVF